MTLVPPLLSDSSLCAGDGVRFKLAALDQLVRSFSAIGGIRCNSAGISALGWDFAAPPPPRPAMDEILYNWNVGSWTRPEHMNRCVKINKLCL